MPIYNCLLNKDKNLITSMRRHINVSEQLLSTILLNIVLNMIKVLKPKEREKVFRVRAHVYHLLKLPFLN